MKRIISILLTIIMAGLVLTGCGSSPSSAIGEKSGDKSKAEAGNLESKEKVNKIIISQSKVEITDLLEECAKEYEKEKGIEVEVWGTTGDDYLQQLKIKLSNNQGPTIFSLAPGSESEDLNNYLGDLSGLSFINDIAENMADEIDGKIAGIPYTVEGFGVVYNKDLIDPSSITSTDAFIEMLKSQKAAGINGFSLSQESYFLIGHILNTPFALQKDPKVYVDQLISGEVTMQETEEFKEFAIVMEAIREHTKNPLEINYDRETGDFATKKSASIHQGNWAYGMFEDYDIDFEMGIMPLPIKENDKIAVSVPTCWYVNSQVSDAEFNAGKDFLEWLYTSETGQRYLTEEFGFIPVLKTMASDQLDPLSQSVADYTADGKTIGWPMNAYWPAGIVDVHLVPVATKFFTTNMTGEELLAELTNAFVNAGQK